MNNEFDKNWIYKAGSEKPKYVCPVCGMQECLYGYEDNSYETRECYCTMCGGEWTENEKYWDCALTSGVIKEEG